MVENVDSNGQMGNIFVGPCMHRKKEILQTDSYYTQPTIISGSQFSGFASYFLRQMQDV